MQGRSVFEFFFFFIVFFLVLCWREREATESVAFLSCVCSCDYATQVDTSVSASAGWLFFAYKLFGAFCLLIAPVISLPLSCVCVTVCYRMAYRRRSLFLLCLTASTVFLMQPQLYVCLESQSNQIYHSCLAASFLPITHSVSQRNRCLC